VYALRLGSTLPRLPIVLAVAYGAALYGLGTVTGNAILDGVVGVLLGLFLSSYPARATVDVLFADRFALEQVWSRWSGRSWLALHGLVLLSGWVVVFVGMVCLVGA
jgi:hypothetical protein